MDDAKALAAIATAIGDDSARRPTPASRRRQTSGDTSRALEPHLDDAALSLGATVARASRSGARVDVVNVFANDPESTAGAGPWDAACGFTSAAEAARARREEDRRACRLLGAAAVWLPFADYEYEQDVDDDGLWAALADVVGAAETVLMPGFPLAAPDHLGSRACCSPGRSPASVPVSTSSSRTRHGD